MDVLLLLLLLLLAVAVYYTPETTRDQHYKVWDQEPNVSYRQTLYNLLLPFAGIFLSFHHINMI